MNSQGDCPFNQLNSSSPFFWVVLVRNPQCSSWPSPGSSPSISSRSAPAQCDGENSLREIFDGHFPSWLKEHRGWGGENFCPTTSQFVRGNGQGWWNPSMWSWWLATKTVPTILHSKMLQTPFFWRWPLHRIPWPLADFFKERILWPQIYSNTHETEWNPWNLIGIYVCVYKGYIYIYKIYRKYIYIYNL